MSFIWKTGEKFILEMRISWNFHKFEIVRIVIWNYITVHKVYFCNYASAIIWCITDYVTNAQKRTYTILWNINNTECAVDKMNTLLTVILIFTYATSTNACSNSKSLELHSNFSCVIYIQVLIVKEIYCYKIFMRILLDNKKYCIQFMFFSIFIDPETLIFWHPKNTLAFKRSLLP